MPGNWKKKVVRTIAVGGLVVLGACYHTITTTNLTPGVQHTEAWVPAFIAGLVPGKVDAGKLCGGKPVQAVESEYSFLNLLVGAITSSIFTPMTVTVTCAG